jgi:hypothetical protein
VRVALERAELGSAAGRDAAYQVLRGILGAARPAVERDELQRLVAGRLRLDSELAARLVPAGGRERSGGAKASGADVVARRDPEHERELLLLAYALVGSAGAREALERLGGDGLGEPLHREARRAILAGPERAQPADAEALAGLEPQLRALAAREPASDEVIEETTARLEADAIQARLDALKARLESDDLSREELRELAQLQARAHRMRELATRASAEVSTR